MAERYAKGRLLQSDEARDPKVRGLFSYFEKEEGGLLDALGAIVLWHRVYARLDVQGAVIYEPSWLHSECFLGQPVDVQQVTRWADALLGVQLLVPYQKDGIRYAWYPEFYANNRALNLHNEDPRYPRPPGWDFDALYPQGGPGRPPTTPAWVSGPPVGEAAEDAGEGDARAPPEDTAPSLPAWGGVEVTGLDPLNLRPLRQLEEGIGEAMATELRRYALQFVEPALRPTRRLPAVTYHAVLAIVEQWRQDGGFRVPTAEGSVFVRWDAARFTLALADVASRVFDGKMRGHGYLQKMLADPDWPPRAEPKKEATEADRVRRSEHRDGSMPGHGDGLRTGTPGVVSIGEVLGGRRKAEEAREEALRQWKADHAEWRARVEAWLAEKPARRERLTKRAEADAAKLPGIDREKTPERYAQTVETLLLQYAASAAGLPNAPAAPK